MDRFANSKTTIRMDIREGPKCLPWVKPRVELHQVGGATIDFVFGLLQVRQVQVTGEP